MGLAKANSRASICANWPGMNTYFEKEKIAEEMYIFDGKRKRINGIIWKCQQHLHFYIYFRFSLCPFKHTQGNANTLSCWFKNGKPLQKNENKLG